jgi:hypothetical protein
VRLAARGLRDGDAGSERIADPVELAQVRRQARVVHIKAVVSAAALTAIMVLL